jgi:hypothetical protein
MLLLLDKKTLLKTTSLLAIILFASCSDFSTKSNAKFIKKYGDRVEQINKKRDIKDKPSEVFLPDVRTFIEGINTTKILPEDMFQIRYISENRPSSYRTSKLSFDDIFIPSKDAFGVRTALGEKNYSLVGNRTLQNNIDFINKYRSPEDKEISLQLIREEKNAKREKYLKLIKSDDNHYKSKILEENMPQNDGRKEPNKEENTKPAPSKFGGLTREIIQ